MMTSSWSRWSTSPFRPLSALPKVCTSLSSNLTLPSPTPSSFITPFKLTHARPCTTRTFSTYDSCQCGPGSHALPGGMVISVECRVGKANVTRFPNSSTVMDSGDAFDIFYRDAVVASKYYVCCSKSGVSNCSDVCEIPPRLGECLVLWERRFNFLWCRHRKQTTVCLESLVDLLPLEKIVH